MGGGDRRRLRHRPLPRDRRHDGRRSGLAHLGARVHRPGPRRSHLVRRHGGRPSARFGHHRLHHADADLRAPRAVPSPGTYIISDQVDLNGTYEPNVDTLFVLTDGSIQIGSISPTRAQGSFTFQGLMSSPPTATVTITSGTFDVPVQAP